MKSRKNLTRFTYETTAFLGWRLTISRNGTTFTKYFSDKKFGSERKSLKVATQALADIKTLLDGSRLVKGKLSQATIRKTERMLHSIS